MKIMWLCNVIIPKIAEKLGLSAPLSNGWLTGSYNAISEQKDIELIYLFPQKEKKIVFAEKNCTFISYPRKYTDRTEKEQLVFFEQILKEQSPDVIHIFGTEYVHSYAMLLAGKNTGFSEKMIVHIQGLTHVIAKHFYSALPEKVVHSASFRDVVRNENVHSHMKSFERRGRYEIEALKLARNVTGRTDWDYACVKRINPDINYYFCNETLRDPFYNAKWSWDVCEKHSIFVSQCTYPIKGFHFMLEAMADIVKIYPDAKLYTTGKNLISLSAKDKLKQKYYHKYLADIVRAHGLEKNVFFIGNLNESQMCERIRLSNVCVCSSSVENSSNFVGESMLIGTPVVASCVGGIRNILEDGKEGYIYQYDAPYMLAHYVMKIFESRDTAEKFSANAVAHAAKTHDKEANFKTMMDIYDRVSRGGSETV